MAVPNIFAAATGSIPLSQLDANFNTAITIGNTAVYLGNTTTTFGNVTLNAPTITSANISAMASSVITAGTAQNTTSGTSIDFTGLPSWVRRLTIILQGVSLSGTAQPRIQLGISSGVTTTGYNTAGGYVGVNIGISTSTSGWDFSGWTSAANIFSGEIVFVNSSSNDWYGSGMWFVDGQAYVNFTMGRITLGGKLDRIRLTSTNGTDTFDAGVAQIYYE